MGLRDILAKLAGNKSNEDFKELQRQQRMQELLDERKKSSDERELELFLRRDREERIKQELQSFREREKQEILTANPLNAPNVVKNTPSVLQTKNLFKEKSNVLNERNLFFK